MGNVKKKQKLNIFSLCVKKTTTKKKKRNPA